MKDLEVAKEELKKHGLNLVVVKDGRILFETREHGLKGLFEAIEKLGGELDGSSAADRIVGLAAALLCAYVKVKAVYAVVASRKALEALEKHGVYVEFEEVVPVIFNRNKTGVCPFEKLAAEISNVEEAYEKLRGLERELRLNMT